MISAKINVKKINKEWLFDGKNGAVYLDIILLESDNDKYGNSHMVVQSVPKMLKDKDPQLRGPILGNAKEFQRRSRAPEPHPDTPKPKTNSPESPIDDDDVPF